MRAQTAHQVAYPWAFDTNRTALQIDPVSPLNIDSISIDETVGQHLDARPASELFS
jgi:hypothetical protein